MTLFLGLHVAGMIENAAAAGSLPLPAGFVLGALTGLRLSTWTLLRFQRDMYRGSRLAVAIFGLPTVLGAIFVDLGVVAHVAHLAADGQWSQADSRSAALAALYSPWLSDFHGTISATTIIFVILTFLSTGSAAVRPADDGTEPRGNLPDSCRDPGSVPADR